MTKFIRIEIPGNLAFKLSEMLIDHAERHCRQSNVQSNLFIAHKLWTIWYQSKTWPGQIKGVIVLCAESVLLCLHLIKEKLKEPPPDEDLKRLYHCFSSGREVGQ